MDKRWNEIQVIWRKNQLLYIVIGYVLGILTFPLFERLSENNVELLKDLVPESIGIVFTVIIIDRLYANRQENQQISELRRRLIREAGGKSNEIAKRAIDEIGHLGWLSGDDGILQLAKLRYADLREVILFRANLRNTLLYRADLSNATIHESDLSGADLRKADLTKAGLHGANLTNANMTETIVNQVRMDEKTIMPDGHTWNPDMDLRRFTDPNYINYWKSPINELQLPLWRDDDPAKPN